VRDTRLEVRVDRVDLAVLDERRGEVSRSEWVRRLIRDTAQPRVILVERGREHVEPELVVKRRRRSQPAARRVPTLPR
jgi:hypothetical protein